MNYIIKKEAHFSFSISLILALIFVFVFILPLVTCPLWGQVVQKKQLTAADYPTFGELQFDKVTPDGHWACFSMVYKNGSDTLFIKNTSTKKIYSFARGFSGQFLNNNHFIYQNKQGLQLLDLNSGKQQTFLSVKQYSCSTAFNQLIILTSNSESAGHLIVVDQNGKTLTKIEKVKNYKMSPKGKELLYVNHHDGNYSLGILSLGKAIRTQWITQKSASDFKLLTWEKTGKALVFLNIDTYGKSILGYYIRGTNFLYQLDPEKQLGFPAEHAIDTQTELDITISEDLSKVFFGIRPEIKKNLNKVVSESESNVELWNGNAKWIYPMEKSMGQFEKHPKLALWSPLSGVFFPITSVALPKVMLAGNQQYAVLSNPQSYEPQYDYNGPRDFFIMDLNTGKKELFLEKQSITELEPIPVPSPGGKYITYFRENNWWAYDLRSKKHINLTSNMGITFNHRNTPDQNATCTIAGWTTGDQEVVLYDQYDIWILKPDGKYFKRITHGREKQIQFRIFQSKYLEGFQANYDGWINKNISLEKGLLLEARGDDEKTGYFSWEAKTEETSIVFKANLVDKLRVVENGKSFIYREQQFDHSPQLVFQKGKIAVTFFQSNPQQSKYSWGRTELISYENSQGEKLKGVLYYPAHYNAQKKYPMIVYLYEKQSHKLHKYVNPSLESDSGYNPTILTSLGYFLLCPDIIRKDQQEGFAALDCTMAATKKVISRGLVYPNKIGLIGHSFGGYETNFIITKTDLFAAAVSGSAVSNIIGYYFTINWELGRPSMNYFKDGQMKIVQSPYEKPEVFARNSPLVHADKITTPLLSFTGKQDNHVDWHQSVELYLALRRLDKKHIMLLYPNEAHSIIDPVNRIDLTTRVNQWFGYYLKDDLPAPWITEGTQ